MSHTPHELPQEFPQYTQLMSALRQSDSHFANLSDRYHQLNRALHRAETNVEPISDVHMVEMRKARMALKDEIYAYLKTQKTPV